MVQCLKKWLAGLTAGVMMLSGMAFSNQTTANDIETSIIVSAEEIDIVNVTIDIDSYGDVYEDGIANIFDIYQITQYLNAGATLTVRERIYADLNADEVIDEDDIDIIKDIYLGYDVSETQTAWYNKYSTQIYNGLHFQYLEDCTIQISGCDDTVISAEIPSQINGMSVTSIGDIAFLNCDNLMDVEIPDSVVNIGNAAFDGCKSLTSITIPSSVTSIGDTVFFGCTSLTSIVIPDSVTSIGNSAFYKCTSLSSVTIPNSVTSIDALAFGYCTNLTTFIIPDSVTSIGRNAFMYCTSLESVIMSNSVESLNDATFCHCESLASFTIPDSVMELGEYVFMDCPSLTSITIPDSVVKIDDYAFSQCSALTSVTILNPNCKLYESERVIYDGATIYGYIDSTAAAYANTYNRNFIALDEESTTTTTATTSSIESETITTTTSSASTDPEETTITTTTTASSYGFINGVDNWSFENYTSSITLSDSLLAILDSNVNNIDWEDINKYLSGEKTTGHCYGMSAVEVLTKDGVINASDIDEDANSLYEVDSPSENEDVDSIIGYYQLLQYTNVFEAKTQKFLRKTNEKRIDELISLVSEVEDGGSPVLVCFDFTETSSKAAQHDYAGHAIVAYGIEYGNYYDDTYDCKILISDPNFVGFNDEYCIYINTETYAWIIPHYDNKYYSCRNDNEDDQPYAQLRYVTNDVNLINYPKSNLGSSEAIDSIISIESSTSNYGVSYYSDDGDASINTDECDLLFYSNGFGGDGDDNIYAILPDADVSYEYFEKSTGEFDTTVEYTNSSLTADVSNGDYAIYIPDESVEFAGEDSDYTLSMVMNDDYHATDWYKVNVSGKSADYAKLAVSDEGYVLTSDGLSEGIYINAANRQVSVSLGIMADCESVLIYEIDENTIGIRLDTDGDGVYETDYEPDYLGDGNLDGTINLSDAVLLQRYLITDVTVDMKRYIAIDVNMDGAVNGFDLAILKQNLLRESS